MMLVPPILWGEMIWFPLSSYLGLVDTKFCLRMPDISYCFVRQDAWGQTQKEFNYIRNKLGLKGNGMLNLFLL